jgi:hypothetical protein
VTIAIFFPGPFIGFTLDYDLIRIRFVSV